MNRTVGALVAWLWAAWLVAGQHATNSFVPQTVMIPMRDGVKLATDIYFPAAPRPWPAVLVRTPYNKSNTGGATNWVAKLDCALVVQDTRGRFASEGENLPFNMEDRDGFDTVQWLVRQAWCNGRIGTWGGSALGIAQLQLAGTGVPELVCQEIGVAGPNLYGDVVYTGGVFRKALAEDWLRSCQFSPRALELWTGHYFYDTYWLARDASRHYAQVNAPALQIGGYFDIFAQATIDSFLGYQTRGGPGARGKQKLLMGPWTHGILTDHAGDLVFPHAQRPPNQVQDEFRWFQRYLQGVMNGVDELPAVTYYVMGDVSDPKAPGNCWRTAAQWPPVPTRSTRWYLEPDLSFSTAHPTANQQLAYAYDPANPVPTIGGYQLTIPAGPKDQRPIESRDDVLVLTSEPLKEPLEMIGQVRAKLYVSTDVPDTDFLVRLCDVYPDGRSFNICEGILRARFRHSFTEQEFLSAGKVYPLEIGLWSTSIIFNKGHRLRVHVTSSSAPGYDPNPNTNEPLRWSSQAAVAHNVIYTSKLHASYLDLPVATHVSR
jgi:predicted acyl esterase